MEPTVVAAQLRAAVRELRVRGLKQATQFAAELLLGMGEAAHRREAHDARRSDDSSEDESEDWAEADRFEAAKACFDVGEYLRAHQMLSHSELGAANIVDTVRIPKQQTRFLRDYALYLVRKALEVITIR
jgi:hypothetical protein